MSQGSGAQEAKVEEAAKYNEISAVDEPPLQSSSPRIGEGLASDAPPVAGKPDLATPALQSLFKELDSPALERWGSPNRTAPLLNVAYLLVHVTLVLVPVLRTAVPSAGCPAELAVNVFFILMLLLVATFALKACAEALWHSCHRRAGSRSGGEDTQHVVCVMIYNEPDEMILSTLKQVNDSPSAPRIRVVIAMEEKTDRQAERAQTYATFLTNVHSTRHYVHPAGLAGESRGLCSNVAWAMNSYLKELLGELATANPEQEDPLKQFVFTKLDAQVFFHEEYFSELEYQFSSWQKRLTKRPVVFQPLMLYHIHRDKTYGPARAVGAMRTLVYGFFFSCGILTATVYSLPLTQYINIGVHHAGYIGEDFMVLAQSTVTSRCVTKVVLMPRTPASTALPLGGSFCESLMEIWRQNKRWSGQTTEVAEFVARNGGCRRAPVALWLAVFGLARVVFSDGIGMYLMVTGIVGQPESCSDANAEVLQFTGLIMQAVTLLACLVVAPVVDQVMSRTLPCNVPLRQLPLTMLCIVPTLIYQNINNLVAYYALLRVGKRAVASHKARAKVV